MPRQVGELKLFDVQELAELLGVADDTIRNYLKAGRIAGQKLGTKWYVSEDGLRDYFNQRRQPRANKDSSQQGNEAD